MQHFRRLAATGAVAIAVGTLIGLLLASCNVAESSRAGGLIPPTGSADAPPVSTTTTVTMVTAAALGDLTDAELGSSQDGLPPGSASASLGNASTPLGNDSAPLLEPSADRSIPTDAAPTDSRSTEPVPTDPVQSGQPGGTLAEAQAVLAAATPLEGFREGVLSATGPAGTQVWPVVIADTRAARQRGLMGITDFAALGGYAAMAFIFEEAVHGAFWMRDTPLPLRITFVAGDGSVVSTTDMVPCLAPIPDHECERYPAAGPYWLAVEHPVGPEFDLGLADAELIELTVE